MTRLSLFRRSILTLVAMCGVFPFILWAANESVKGMFNSPFLWVPLGNEKRDQFWWFVESFNAQDAVIVSWPGCTVDDERLERLESVLLSDAPANERTSCKDLYQRVSTGYTAVRELQEEPLNLSRKASLRRLRGTLIGDDGRTSCAVVVMTLEGVIERELSIETILRIAETELGVERQHCYLGGLLVTGLAIDRESTRALDYFSVPSIVLVIVLCWLCLRSWRLMLPIVVVAAFGERLVMSTVHLSGGNMNAVLIVMSPFVFVLAVSAGVHLANYYTDEVRLHGPKGASARSLAVGLAPCGLAAVTTTIGLLSLLICDIVPVREFGFYSALCMLIAVTLLFLVFPGITDKWPAAVANHGCDHHALIPVGWLSKAVRRCTNRPVDGLGRPSYEEPRSPMNQSRANPQIDVLGAISRLVCRRSGWVIIVSLGVMGVSCWGLIHVRTSVDVLELLSAKNRTIEDHQWLETNVAPLAPLEIIVHFDKEYPLGLAERMEVVRDVQREVATIESIGGTMSALTFVPPIPRSGSLRNTARRAVFQRQVLDERPRLAELGYLDESDTHQSWRITARAPALGDLDYRTLLDELAAKVDPIVQRHGNGLPGTVSAMYTGNMPIVVDAQQVLLRELMVSYLTAFAIIAVVIMLAVRSVTAGLVAMVPNLFPSVVLFGTMGWLNRPLDIGAMMTASVALGIAVDDTLHLLLWFRRGLSAGKSATAAVTSAIHHCGRAMTHTTLICGCGMLVFTLSDFEPTRQFALMMFLLLAAALVGDLFILPALLVGPFRKVFHRGIRTDSNIAFPGRRFA